jgi:hypothetical protein
LRRGTGRAVIVALALVHVALASTGCGGKHRRAKGPGGGQAGGPIASRIAAAGTAWDRYSAEDKALVQRGEFRVGLDELAAYIARGNPELTWKTRQPDTTCTVLLYAMGQDPSVADTAVTSCFGAITKRTTLEPALPCWRLAEIGPRMVEQQTYFEGLALDRQWKIVEGILERGQNSSDVTIAFGKPYNTGTEAREDKTNASTMVFLDHAHEAYGLHVTLVDDRVVAWKIPAERVLTPEAQRRQALAASRQASAEAEQRAANQHAEEMQRQNEVQQKSSAFLLEQAGALAGNAASQAPPVTIGASHSSSTTSGEKKLTINNCTYTDGPNGALGQSCGVPSPACPAGYTCSISGGSSGFCVPSGQTSACRGKKR